MKWVREEYRKRFGIETSYRQMNQGRIRTCTRNPVLRLLFVGIALLLRNVWVWFHLNVLADRHANGRLLLRLERLCPSGKRAKSFLRGLEVDGLGVAGSQAADGRSASDGR